MASKNMYDYGISLVNLSLPKNGTGRVLRFKGIYPESVSETPSAPIYGGQDIPGRSAPVQYYQGGEVRTVSFSFQLHRNVFVNLAPALDNEVFPDVGKIKRYSNPKITLDGKNLTGANSSGASTDNFRAVLRVLEAMNYPRYSKGGVVPPLVYCELGKSHIKIKGYPNITVEYQLPISPKGFYMSAMINVSISEVLQKSWDSSEVIDNRKRYKSYSKQVR